MVTLSYVGALAALTALTGLLAVRPLPTSKVNKLVSVRVLFALAAITSATNAQIIVSVFSSASYYWGIWALALMAACTGALLHSIVYESSLTALKYHENMKVTHYVQ